MWGEVIPSTNHIQNTSKCANLLSRFMDLNKFRINGTRNFDRTILSNGFKINECDKCVYMKSTQSDFVIACIYVDDMLITGSNIGTIIATSKMFMKHFDMKDMGIADVILGIKIIRTLKGLI